VSDQNLFAQQRANRRRSLVLVTVFLLFFAWVGFGGDLAFYLSTRGSGPAAYHHTIPWIGLVTTTIAVIVTFFAWRSGPKQVLWSTGAWELVSPSKPEEQQLVNVVEEMAVASGLPRPKIWIIPDDDPNAFATGTDERHAHVAVTEGLLSSLNRDELQGVIAHEIAHVQNHDVRLMTLLAALVGVMALLSDGMTRTLRFGGYRGSRGGGRSGGGRKGGGGGALVLVVLVLWIISIILAPLIGQLLALTVSRKREFLADATGAQFTRNPSALASALRKIENAVAPTRSIKRGAAHLCIADPLGRPLTHKQGFLADAMATHPPMAVRIARLEQMAFQHQQTGAPQEGA
jgi:heat shock protein HtpX